MFGISEESQSSDSIVGPIYGESRSDNPQNQTRPASELRWLPFALRRLFVI